MAFRIGDTEGVSALGAAALYMATGKLHAPSRW